MIRIITVARAALLALSLCATAAAWAEGPRGNVYGCPDGTFDPMEADIDVSISAPCKVKAGTYKVRDVHVLKNGVLEFEDATIDFWAANILVEKDGVLIAGSETAPIGTAPGAVVTIHLYGADQTGQDPKKLGQGVPCWTDNKAQCGVPDAIWHSNMAGMSMDGMDMKSVPLSSAKTIKSLGAVSAQYPRAADDPKVIDDYFYAYDPLFLDGKTDSEDRPGYFGYKVLGVSYGGTLKLFGRKGATYDAIAGCGAAPSSSGSSWARLAAPWAAGTTITVDRPLTLAKGDELVVTSTDYMPGHSEEVVVAADVTCATSFTVTKGPTYKHNGTRFAVTAIPADFGIDPQLRASGAEVRAAVGRLTRSIRIVSEGDTMNDAFPAAPDGKEGGPAGYYFGGHVVARQGLKYFQVQGVEFKQLGQGGKLGHYPVHFHHARVTPAQTFVRDSSINESMTRWIVLHGTQNVELARNVGWKSIGHGFYLEDGTEINNVLTANLGVFARAAVDNPQNPRKVPGILAAPDLHNQAGSLERPPFRTDYDHPTIFWIMNAYNDFKDNMAVGAGTCGVCYWMLPGVNSGMSRSMAWTSYAAIQRDESMAGTAPLKSFVGNYCSAAMTAIQTVRDTAGCIGVGPGGGPIDPLIMQPIKNPLAYNADGGKPFDYYPTQGNAGLFPTACEGDACNTVIERCSAGHAENCKVTVLDHFTTSFNWAAYNFAAIWLRPQWYLVTDSVITDVQNAGLTIVTGGGYTASDVIPGHWALVRKSIFIGNTQEDDAFASNGGPFNPKGAHCETKANGGREDNFCLSKSEGVSHQESAYGMNQRLFNVYDGPAFQETNAYLNITERRIDDCVPFLDAANKVGQCRRDGSDIKKSQWISGSVQGLLKTKDRAGTEYCYMPNAAIGWKQPNGFYYPPAFHSADLFFDKVDIRHFVLSPPFTEGTQGIDFKEVQDTYCVFNSGLFEGFTANDRQTVLNDDDGTMTGYEKTTVINADPFFAAPVDALQCRSDQSSRTSPYSYVTTVIYPKCKLDGTCAAPPVVGNPNTNNGDWNLACSNELCYGVPLWRQDQMPIADKNPKTGVVEDKSMRMMGQSTSQRSSLTVNHGTYYFDTAVGRAEQIDCKPTGGRTCEVNVFKPNETYYLFLIFAKADTEQTYRFYVGDDPDFDPASIRMMQADITTQPPVYADKGALPAGSAKWYTGNRATAKGVVEVKVRVADLPGLAGLIEQAAKDKCKPASFCAWNAGSKTCVDSTSQKGVCKWAEADQDCPAGGCFGITFKMPASFTTRGKNAPDVARPKAVCIPKSGPFNVTFKKPDDPYDTVCPVPTDALPADFCAE